jgi:hypothetical protein
LRADFGRTVFAVLAGYLTNATLVWATERSLAGMPKAGSYWIVALVSQCSILTGAGYLCALIAEPAGRKTATLGFIGVALFAGAFSLTSHWRTQPQWYCIALPAIVPPCAFLGYLSEGFLNRRRE